MKFLTVDSLGGTPNNHIRLELKVEIFTVFSALHYDLRSVDACLKLNLLLPHLHSQETPLLGTDSGSPLALSSLSHQTSDLPYYSLLSGGPLPNTPPLPEDLSFWCGPDLSNSFHFPQSASILLCTHRLAEALSIG